MALDFSIVQPSLGNPRILKPADLKSFELTLAGTSTTPPTVKVLKDFLVQNPIKLVASPRWEIPLHFISCAPVFKHPKFTADYGSTPYQGVNNRELQYLLDEPGVGFRWEAKITVGVAADKIAGFGNQPRFAAIKSPLGELRPHALYLDDHFEDFTILQISDLHIAQRNDKIPEILCEVRNEFECNHLKESYVNYNDHFRAFIRYANRRVERGEKILVVATGDLVDYAFDGWWDGYPIPGQAGDRKAPRRFHEAEEYREKGGTYGYSNIQKFKEIVLGADGKGEELKCPIYTILGNHDYYPYEYLMFTKIELKSDPVKKSGSYGLSDSEGKEYDYWAYRRNQAGHPSPVERKNLHSRIASGDGHVWLNTDWGYWLIKPKGWTLAQYIKQINYEVNFAVSIGKTSLLFFNTGHERYPSKGDFLEDYLLDSADHYVKDFVADGPHSIGITDEHLQLLREAQQSMAGDGHIHIFTHSPILNFRKSRKEGSEVLYESRAADKDPVAVEKWLKDTYGFKTRAEIVKAGFSVEKTPYFKTGSRSPYLDFHCAEGKVQELLDAICHRSGATQKVTCCVFSGDTHVDHEFHVNKIAEKSGDTRNFYYFTDDYHHLESKSGIVDLLHWAQLKKDSPFFFITGALRSKNPAFREIGTEGFPQKLLWEEMKRLNLTFTPTANFTPGCRLVYLVTDQQAYALLHKGKVELRRTPDAIAKATEGIFEKMELKDHSIILRPFYDAGFIQATGGGGSTVAFDQEINSAEIFKVHRLAGEEFALKTTKGYWVGSEMQNGITVLQAKSKDIQNAVSFRWLPAQVETGRLEGSILGSGGEKLKFPASVQISNYDNNLTCRQMEAKDVFSFRGLKPGSYRLTITPHRIDAEVFGILKVGLVVVPPNETIRQILKLPLKRRESTTHPK